MDDVLEVAAPRKRQRQVRVADAIEVRAAIAPVVSKIGPWQRTMALARAKLIKGNLEAWELAGLCRGIVQEVESGRRLIHRSLPQRLRHHDRLVDIERSLSTVERVAHEVLEQASTTSS